MRDILAEKKRVHVPYRFFFKATMNTDTFTNVLGCVSNNKFTELQLHDLQKEIGRQLRMTRTADIKAQKKLARPIKAGDPVKFSYKEKNGTVHSNQVGVFKSWGKQYGTIEVVFGSTSIARKALPFSVELMEPEPQGMTPEEAERWKKYRLRPEPRVETKEIDGQMHVVQNGSEMDLETGKINRSKKQVVKIPLVDLTC